MSFNVSLNSILNPCVICTNIGVNALTKLYASNLSPLLNADQKMLYAAHFHYIVKVTAYNIATTYLAWRAVKVLSGASSIGPSIALISTTLFIRLVIERSLSVQTGVTSTAKGFLDKALKIFTDKESLEGLSTKDQAFTSACLIISKNDSLSNKNWKESPIIIQGYPILKHWPQATYNFLYRQI